MTPHVVDTSVVIKWFVDVVHAEAACRLQKDQYELAHELAVLGGGQWQARCWGEREVALTLPRPLRGDCRSQGG